MNPEYWLARADRSLVSAALLAESGDYDRAASTAYYAMFYAARVSLLHVGQAERAMGKTHSGMGSAFSQFLVKPGLLDVRYQRAFSFELNRRILADYEEGEVSAEGAAESIESANAFVAAVTALIALQSREKKRNPGSSPG